MNSFFAVTTYMISITYNTIFVDNDKGIRVRTGISFVIHVIHVGLFCGIVYPYAFECYKKIIVLVEYMNIINKVSQISFAIYSSYL